MERTVDVAVIGAGSAGLSALKEIRKETDNFVLIQDGPHGTTCARVGCMPSKVLIQAAHDFHRRNFFEKQGISGGDKLQADVSKTMAHVRELRDYFVAFVLDSVENYGDKVINGRARFVEPTVLKVDDKHTIRANSIVIATGSSPVVPEDWKAFGNRVVTTDQFFELETVPETIAVVGLGVIGAELGQALARLGVKTVGFNRSRTVAGISDPTVNQAAIQALEKDFPLCFGHAPAVSEVGQKLKVRSGEKAVEVDLILAAMGRTPNLTSLGLAEIGIALNEKGLPSFDPTTGQIGDTRIFIAGDVNGEKQILHEASDEGVIAGFNAVRPHPHCFTRRAGLGITFCEPNIAFAGQRHSELKPGSFAIGEVSFKSQGRATIKKENEGLLRVYADAEHGLMLGAEMVAPGGEHMAHLLAWAVQQGNTVFDLLHRPFYHPVLEEGLRTALRDLAKNIKDGHLSPELAMCGAQPANRLD